MSGEQATVLRSSYLYDVVAAETFGKLMRRYREIRNLNQTEVAALADTHQATISAIERDEQEPSFEMIARIAEALRIPQDEVSSSMSHLISAARGRVPASMKDIRAAIELRETMRKKQSKR
jgi:transcriptional regulator with XRE-family HTH domain